MPNRLARESSPYLRQHQDNPVDWMPWGDEAFSKAEREGKPVFLSVGYSSCHWCHVMAHESFEDESVADRLNANFVSVKVDREERPDVDEAYMAFVQSSTGRGGWPMSVFLTPDRKPFYGGTYWPKEDAGGHPGFIRILEHLGRLWSERREEVLAEAERIGEELVQVLTHPAPAAGGTLDAALYGAALQAQVETFDPEQGGFGRAPKFPPHTAIDLFLNHALCDFAQDEERQADLAMAFVTLEKMCLGGIHDHVGGGFHRYSTDSHWLLPHFEKMLYDNALMLSNLAQAATLAVEIDPARATLFARAAGGIATWVAREMTSPEGLFYSALDADSLNEDGHHEEGAFYVWDHGDLSPALAQAFQARPEGNFRDEASGALTGKNILHLQEDVGDGFDAELDALLARRAQRVRPGLDNKAIVGWNGLMIAALAQAGLDEPAERAARALWDAYGAHGRVPHQITEGTPSGDAFLEDVAAFAYGLYRLTERFEAMRETDKAATFRAYAAEMAILMIRDFEDSSSGAFFSTGPSHEALFGRTKPAFDQPIPSANSLALRVLLAMGDGDRAAHLVSALLGLMERAPSATEGLYAAAIPLVVAPQVDPIAPPITNQPTVRLQQNEVQADAEGMATLTIVLDLPQGLHVNGPNPPARWLTPTRVTVHPLKAEVRYPPESGIGYAGRIEIPATVRLPAGHSGSDLEVVVAYQPCTDTECLAPVERTLGAVVYR